MTGRSTFGGSNKVIRFYVNPSFAGGLTKFDISGSVLHSFVALEKDVHVHVHEHVNVCVNVYEGRDRGRARARRRSR
jgi:hypothetical protein